MHQEIIPISDGSGELHRLVDYPSHHTSPRNVDIWLPPGYADQTELHYPVLYMHDGQNLFDPAFAYGGVDWGIDEAVQRWMDHTGKPGVIVVGIWNSPQRWQDYMPERPFAAPGVRAQLQQFVSTAGGPPRSDDYLCFLVTELKPYIDSHVRTLPGQSHTFVMGSSMGGLISLYALSEYPSVFSGAGCLSTHWPAGGQPLVDGMGAALPRAEQHRLYFDFGTTTLDESYEPFQHAMDRWVEAAGYQDGVDWLTRKFDGAEHSERAWRVRVDLPLAFLLAA